MVFIFGMRFGDSCVNDGVELIRLNRSIESISSSLTKHKPVLYATKSGFFPEVTFCFIKKYIELGT